MPFHSHMLWIDSLSLFHYCSWSQHLCDYYYSSFSHSLDPFVILFPLYIITPALHSFTSIWWFWVKPFIFLVDELFVLVIATLVYSIDIIVQIAPQLCNLRILLYLSQSSVLLWKVSQVSWEPPASNSLSSQLCLYLILSITCLVLASPLQLNLELLECSPWGL